ncbi:YadA C-terminal domain-containing protein [Fusobacterium hwasookii]|uniref:Trimeric autotransporter adhesin YadA-like C-terminal membrane anchor domain-containing protein n=1 Tax=Fusobacterium hwasookii ChDC F128 TaxID=1216362 RepID=A0ABP2R919_9FUSO|nr:YadA C-terminal domain-containing protein [Fusobacterium hwasookii]EJU08683.1 hypothetical protein B437_01095 [Fusobacterium hwasookii ChDC F128]QNE67048.1 YadA C-terminal domain-containing protein [Fusobacterium hwasookii]
MKNKLFNIILYIFLLNSINIFSSDTDVKEIEPIESIHSDNNNSISVNNNQDNAEDMTKKDTNSIDLKSKNTISTNKDLRNNKKEEDNREDRFEEITDRTNRITALGSAMGAVDLSKTPANKFRVGAGVGHSAKNQAVAVGIGYAPTERLRLNTKISTTTNSTRANRSNGISIGASYDLDW